MMKRKLLSLAVAALVFTGLLPVAVRAEITPDAAVDASFSDSVIGFLARHSDAPRPVAELPVVKASDAPTVLEQDKTVEWRFDVPVAGLYKLRITYKALGGLGIPPTVTVAVNGSLPYNEAASVTLKRKYTEVNIGRKDALGNEIIPDSQEVVDTQTAVLTDMAGYWGDHLSFELRQGENTLALTMESESVEISGLSFFNEAATQSYADYAAGSDETGGGDYVNYIEAERLLTKSDTTIYPLNDRTSPATSPYSPKTKNLNTIGAFKWNTAGQYIEWGFDVPADGLYQIALKYRQNINDSMSSYRRIYIDDRLLFSELDCVEFPYDTGWNHLVLGGKTPYLFALEKGPHRIKAEVVLGELSEILPRVQDSVTALNDAYRKMIMLMGSSPDPYRDYRLFEALPEVVDTLAEQAKVLRETDRLLLGVTKKASVGSKAMTTLARQLEEFCKNTDVIQQRLSQFKANISALSAWMIEAKTQPLEVDYLAVYQPGATLKKPDANFWGVLRHEINTFLYTFSSAYQMVAYADAIDIWVQTGRDQAETVSELIINDFTPKTDIKVNVKLVQGQLLMAVAAGRGPDIALQVPAVDAMNYAFRNATVNLAQFDGIDTVKSRFRDSALTPLSFDGGLYGLPETQTFPMLFYRTDVLKELAVQVPETWQETTSLIAKLQKKNLEFGLPPAFYPTLLLQNGGSLYNESGSKTLLSERSAVTAFEQWTAYFTNYRLPVAYDAMNRFRTGEMPALIADFTLYNQLMIGAPEIMGLWSIAPIPGVLQPDGSVNNSAAATGVCTILFKRDAQTQKNAFAFMDWWSSADTQKMYGNRIEIVLGPAGRYPSANIEAFRTMPWLSADMRMLDRQSESVLGIPEVPGGYFMSRHIENAFRSVINRDEAPGETLVHYAEIIDKEIGYKRQELKLDK